GRAIRRGAVAEQVARLDPVLGVAAAWKAGLEDVVVVVLHHRRVLDRAAAGAVVDDGREHAGLVGDARLDVHLALADAGFRVAALGRLGVVGHCRGGRAENDYGCEKKVSHVATDTAASRQPQAAHAAAVAPCGESLTETVFEMPGSSIVTP